jgi:hypothetical protein
MITDNRIFSRNFAVYDEIRHENWPYFTVILVTVNRHRIQHRILCRIRSYTYRILITNGRKPPTWIPVTIRCVNGPYLTVYGRICTVFSDQGSLLDLRIFIRIRRKYKHVNTGKMRERKRKKMTGLYIQMYIKMKRRKKKRRKTSL